MSSPNKTRRALLLGAAIAVSLLVVGCSAQTNNKQNSLQPKGSAAKTIDNLFVPIAILAIIIGIAATIYFAFRFRYREGKNDNPKQIHGNTRLEIGWTIAPALLLAVIAVPSVSAIFKLAENPGPDALQVTVIGKQW